MTSIKNHELQFEQIYRRNYSRLYYYALNIVCDKEAARDIVGDVMTVVWHNIATIDDKTLNDYLLTSVRNRCVDRLRHLKQEQRYSDNYINEATLFYSDYGDEIEKDRLVEQMLSVLKPPTDMILRMCYLDRMKYREVAQKLSISESTVKKHIMKALKTLRELYKDKKCARKTD